MMIERNALRYYILPFCLIRFVKYYVFVITFSILYNNLTFVCIKWPKRSLNPITNPHTFINQKQNTYKKHTDILCNSEMGLMFICILSTIYYEQKIYNVKLSLK